MGKIFHGGRAHSVYGRFVRRIPKPCGPKDRQRAGPDGVVAGNSGVARASLRLLRSIPERRTSSRPCCLPRGVSREPLVGHGPARTLGLSPAVVNLLRDAKDLFLKSTQPSRGTRREALVVAPDIGSGGVACVVRNLTQYFQSKGHSVRDLPLRSFVDAAIETQRVGRHGNRFPFADADRRSSIRRSSLPAFALLFPRGPIAALMANLEATHPGRQHSLPDRRAVLLCDLPEISALHLWSAPSMAPICFLMAGRGRSITGDCGCS